MSCASPFQVAAKDPGGRGQGGKPRLLVGRGSGDDKNFSILLFGGRRDKGDEQGTELNKFSAYQL